MITVRKAVMKENLIKHLQFKNGIKGTFNI